MSSFFLYCHSESDQQAVDRTVPSSGAADKPIVLSGLACNGGESSLSECTRATTISQCTHAKDAGVRCSKQAMNLIMHIHMLSVCVNVRKIREKGSIFQLFECYHVNDQLINPS